MEAWINLIRRRVTTCMLAECTLLIEWHFFRACTYTWSASSKQTPGNLSIIKFNFSSKFCCEAWLLTRVTVARRSLAHRLVQPVHLALQRSRSWAWYHYRCWLSSLPCNRPCCQSSSSPSLTGPASRLWPVIALAQSHHPMPFICSLRWHYKA